MTQEQNLSSHNTQTCMCVRVHTHLSRAAGGIVPDKDVHHRSAQRATTDTTAGRDFCKLEVV